MTAAQHSLKKRALRLLARREYSRVELRRKLLALARAAEVMPSGATACPLGATACAGAGATACASAKATACAGAEATACAGAEATACAGAGATARAGAEATACTAAEAAACTALDETASAAAELKALAAAQAAPAGEADIDALLDWLEARGHLSCARFVEAKVHTRAPRFGVLRIERELAQHGLEPDPELARELRMSEFDRARAVWARKFEGPASDAAAHARQVRFLAGRGFSIDVIQTLLRSVGREAGRR